MSTLRITNATRGSIIATHATIANDPQTRRQGLIGMTAYEFQPGAGLFFPECNAIHTIEMFMAIDVLFIDMLMMQVRKVAIHVAPGCHVNTPVPLQVCAVLELPDGVIRVSGTEQGDVIQIMSAGHEPLASSSMRLRA